MTDTQKLQEASNKLHKLASDGEIYLHDIVTQNVLEKWEHRVAQTCGSVFIPNSGSWEYVTGLNRQFSILSLLLNQTRSGQSTKTQIYNSEGRGQIRDQVDGVRYLLQSLDANEIRDDLITPPLSTQDKISKLQGSFFEGQGVLTSGGHISQVHYDNWHAETSQVIIACFGADSAQARNFINKFDTKSLVEESLRGTQHEATGSNAENHTDKMKRLIGDKLQLITVQLQVLYSRQAAETSSPAAAVPINSSTQLGTEMPTPEKRVFIVHGHDHQFRDQVDLYINKLGLKTTVLDAEPSGGATLIEKLEKYASPEKVQYAVILYTADDYGISKKELEQNSDAQYHERARQNIVLETGWFYASIGRHKTCILRANGVELPSDLKGTVYSPTDDQWKDSLHTELQGAGLIKTTVL